VLNGVLFGSLLFAFSHLSVVQGIGALMWGIALHFIYLTTRSLWMPMLCHFLNNSTLVIAQLLTEPDDMANQTAKPIPVYLLAAAILLCGAAAWALYQCSKLIPLAPHKQSPSSPEFHDVAHSISRSDTIFVPSRPAPWTLGLVVIATILFGAALWLTE
jgi:hypothetical protein